MFLSSVKGLKEFENVNMDFLMKNLASQGFTTLRQKSKDLEAGLNIASFTIQKNNINMAIFILRIGKNQFICSGYHHGKIVKEKECKYESDVPNTIIDIFNHARSSAEDQPIRFDIQLEMMQSVCQRIEKTEKNINSFTQEVKTSKQYENFKTLEKRAYQKLINDSQTLLQNKDNIAVQNNNLVEPLLRVETCKQALQTQILAFEEESAYLSNAKERLKESIDIMKEAQVQLNPSKLNETTFKQYLDHVTKLKTTQLKQKYLIG